ncbi:BMP family ABC transporter substrate-binding protein [Maledivibacter halophilus]|uniref:Basic membrane protein A n=1 Tax=Maledivibacter halophilus TaxID=36842 RepID=A0A1T5J6Q0_9FIRM|nr:BMP family ABC transporter substrate-binding protein [Maledivibacter halophilus]SKC47026.1 basic membrane protein A [Maledivibacter halophilus]
MKKRITKVVSLFLIFSILLVGCSTSNTQNDTSQNETSDEKSEFKAAVLTIRKLTTPADLNTLDGINKLKDELGIDIKIVECIEISEYKEQVQALSEEGYDVIYFIYDNFLEAVEEIAPNYPDTKYIGLWIDKPDHNLANFKPLFFRPEQGAFLSGVVAALTTETNQVGFIGGGINPGILTFLAGYEAGIKYIDPDVELAVSWAGTFEDPLKGKELGTSLYGRGVDVIFQVANQTGLGVIHSAKEQNKYAIGVDVDQSDLAPGNVVASCLLDHGYATYDSIKQAYEGNFNTEQVYYGLKEGMNVVAIPDFVSQDVKDKVKEIEEKIINGEITIPKTTETR